MGRSWKSNVEVVVAKNGVNTDNNNRMAPAALRL